ncbi:MAG: hypothetical protein ACLQIB_16260, partial [Isosphaeraceae bacterium]
MIDSDDAGNLALPFFGASIPGFVGLLTGRGPFSPALALIPGRSGNLSACLRIMMRSGARGKWRVGVDLVSIGETDPTLAVRFPV